MKRIRFLVLMWIAMYLVLLIFWPVIKETANASRPCDAIGGEYLLWVLPTVTFICLMPDTREEKKNGR